jgi:8-oxo-dGTP diphosphatase
MNGIGLKRAGTLCILRNNDKFLLLKRNNEPNKGKITPVGGKLEPFESPLKAAIRETYEETGVILESMDFCGMLTESSPLEYNWILYVFLADIEWIEPPECDEGVLEWIPFDEIVNFPTPETDFYIYSYILKRMKFVFTAEYDSDLVLVSMNEDLEGKKIV